MNMYRAEIRFLAEQFLERMNEMRLWLDSRRFEPAVFRYDHVEEGIVFHVEFTIEDQAAAFAQEFGGTLLP
jgi:hypothetical protein